jgi:hypothetical protein
MPLATANGELSTAVVGAAVGVILTVGINALIRYLRERSRQCTILDEVWREVDELSSAAASRIEQARDGLSLFPPLRNEVWKIARSARALERLGAAEREALVRLYDEVEAANYLGRQGHAFFGISQIADGESVVRLEAEARRLTSQPFDDVVNAAVAAKETRR